MAIANETIIKRMIQELYSAQENQHKPQELQKNIENVRLLCDLFLEEDQPATPAERPEFSDAEIKAMLGAGHGNKGPSQKQRTASSAYDEGEGDGDSIFDF